MRQSNFNLLFLFLLGIVLSTVSCKREFKRPTVENEILAPILTTKLTINEIVPDSIRKESEDGHVSLVYRNNLYAAGLGSFQALETREFEETAKLQSLSLSSRSAERIITLGQVLDETLLSLFLTHGDTDVIQQQNGFIYGPISMDGTEIFETVTLDSGYMDVKLENNFPTGLSNIQFEIHNDNQAMELIGSDTFDNVPVGETRQITFDLAGKTVDGNLLGTIANFDVDGTSSPVYIDSNDQIIVTITVRNTKVNSATAIFPEQEIIELRDTTAMKNVGDLRLTKATAKTGFVDLRVVSTLPDTVYFDYFIPEGKKDGVPLSINAKIPPTSSRTFEIDVNGYTFDLTGSPIINGTNAFYSELTGRIDSTGKVISLSLQDSLLVYVSLRDFIPEYIEGYLGHNAANIGPQQVPLSLFRNFYSGTLNFENVEVNLGVTNETGVPYEVDLKSLQAINTRTNKTEIIDLSSLPNPIAISAASSVNAPWSDAWSVSGNTNSLNSALNIFPNQMRVELSVSSNPEQNTNMLAQFASDAHKISAYTDIEIPLSMIAEDLVIADTVTFDAGEIENPEEILSGIFYITSQNAFPFKGLLEMHFLDATGSIIESIAPGEEFEAGKRNQPNESILEWPFDRSMLTRILGAEKVILKTKLSTSQQDFQKIYTDQALEVTFSARFNYMFEAQ